MKGRAHDNHISTGQPAPHSAAAAEHLATGYIALSCAAITAVQLVAVAAAYQGTAGRDLQMAIASSPDDLAFTLVEC